MRSVVSLFSIVATACFLVTAPVPAHAEDVVTGEILDMACYIPKGAKGPSHARCAQTCADHGMPLGILAEDDTVYLLYPKHGKEEAFDDVKKLAGKKAKLTGKKAERSGLRGFEVHAAVAAD
jgi:hypothetical protein